MFCHAKDVSRVASGGIESLAEIADGSDHGGTLFSIVNTVGGCGIQLGHRDGHKRGCDFIACFALLRGGAGGNEIIALIFGDARGVASWFEKGFFVEFEAHGETTVCNVVSSALKKKVSVGK